MTLSSGIDGNASANHHDDGWVGPVEQLGYLVQFGSL